MYLSITSRITGVTGMILFPTPTFLPPLPSGPAFDNQDKIYFSHLQQREKLFVGYLFLSITSEALMHLSLET